MSVQQLSVFLENKKGHLATVTKILTEGNIDIRGVIASDTSDYGITRLIVNKPYVALSLLKDNGFTAKVSKVVAVEPEDRVGFLGELFTILGKAEINIDYIYALSLESDTLPVFLLKTEDPDRAEMLLKEQNIKVL